MFQQLSMDSIQRAVIHESFHYKYGSGSTAPLHTHSQVFPLETCPLCTPPNDQVRIVPY